MKKSTKASIEVRGTLVNIVAQDQEDYLCLTDIARFKDLERTDYLISNWMRNRNTVEYLGIWEQIHNPHFNPIEFDGIKKQAGLNSFILTAKQWSERTGAIGHRIRKDALNEKKAEYGQKFLNAVSAKLTSEFQLFFTSFSLSNLTDIKHSRCLTHEYAEC